jgi:8-oxo-dGTP pyrophosphatase MutT (NUDIX family)
MTMLQATLFRQAAAIPLRDGLVCLIRSSNGKRWIIPKGHIERGQTAAATALREAWEEAGLVGTLAGPAVGSYIYEKGGARHLVRVYQMTVTEVAKLWPEHHRRPRRWFDPEAALGLVDQPALRRLLRRLLRLQPALAAS